MEKILLNLLIIVLVIYFFIQLLKLLLNRNSNKNNTETEDIFRACYLQNSDLIYIVQRSENQKDVDTAKKELLIRARINTKLKEKLDKLGIYLEMIDT